jgi:hypothetical protein
MSRAVRTFEWVPVPTNWIRFERGLDQFPVNRLGHSIAALKLYMTIAMAHARALVVGKGASVRLSYSDLEQMSGVSRGMIGPSLSLLGDRIEIGRGGGRRTNEYTLLGYPPVGGWAKLPAAHLLSSSALLRFEPRSKTDLAALKMYSLLVALRHNDTGWAQISYTKATEYMNTTRDYVSRAVSKLIDADLIFVRRAHQAGIDDSFAPQRNIYSVKGLRRSNAPAAFNDAELSTEALLR